MPVPVAAAADASGVSDCEALPFEPTTPVPEASGAAWLTIDGALRLVVAGDSGNHGAYGVIDPASGKTLEQGTLPLNLASDDIEGLAARGDRLFGITSPGWILEWKRSGTGFVLVAGPYALGPVDLPPTGGLGDKPPKGNGMVCDGTRTNCGRNYEGLCLTEHGGYVASKADGHLYPVTGDDKLVVERAGAIAVADPGHLADCAYDGGTLYVGNNLFGLSTVSRVVDGKVLPIASIGVGFPEVLAVRGDVFYRMSDTGSTPSLMSKFRCSASAR
ncbi:MAG: hypothetical protein ABI591_28130 [Kofleriaceae bacterium]